MVIRNETQEIEITLFHIRNTLRDINLKMDHLIRTYHNRFFEIDDPDPDERLER
mgnify:CR=1